ncbi:hypothetical protein [Microvirus mar35]|uniref:Uncharacterized protein n=1 Tax=Microvirus mar35 TaxID=2851169 RepID=A0A8F5RAZ8_9VIRU|nr:hypothetical protein [Microvirus mar35]
MIDPILLLLLDMAYDAEVMHHNAPRESWFDITPSNNKATRDK